MFERQNLDPPRKCSPHMTEICALALPDPMANTCPSTRPLFARIIVPQLQVNAQKLPVATVDVCKKRTPKDQIPCGGFLRPSNVIKHNFTVFNGNCLFPGPQGSRFISLVFYTYS